MDLRLSYGEIIVLFELLHRWEDDGTLDGLPYVDETERIAMWNLNAALEGMVDELFSGPADYQAAVDAARSSLRPE